MSLGFFISAIGLISTFYLIYLKIFTDSIVDGLASTLTTITVFSGFQIMLIGLLGQYVARIFEEVKDRPLYIIKYNQPY